MISRGYGCCRTGGRARHCGEGVPQMIVVNEGAGKPYSLGYVQKLHRQIRVKAGLPDDLRFTSFRHGRLTEIGDAGEADMRAVSGHSEIKITKIYDKASREKARRIAVTHRAHIVKITGGAKAGDE